eukprot:911268-Prymnesium_polylepis.1
MGDGETGWVEGRRPQERSGRGGAGKGRAGRGVRGLLPPSGQRRCCGRDACACGAFGACRHPLEERERRCVQGLGLGAWRVVGACRHLQEQPDREKQPQRALRVIVRQLDITAARSGSGVRRRPFEQAPCRRVDQRALIRHLWQQPRQHERRARCRDRDIRAALIGSNGCEVSRPRVCVRVRVCSGQHTARAHVGGEQEVRHVIAAPAPCDRRQRACGAGVSNRVRAQ